VFRRSRQVWIASPKSCWRDTSITRELVMFISPDHKPEVGSCSGSKSPTDLVRYLVVDWIFPISKLLVVGSWMYNPVLELHLNYKPVFKLLLKYTLVFKQHLTYTPVFKLHFKYTSVLKLVLNE
jgi:hypothetical protein